ncbi:MAG: beta-N-acetylhexosaminidase, partial [Prolixibacteraceae bacterium]|nr:beta-N-acetylhexosaminidase [Prolixibacteraceae bacterium]
MKTKLISLFLLMIFSRHLSAEGEIPMIFPIPQEMEITQSKFNFNENTRILIPQHASKNDLRLAYLLVSEISDKFGVPVKAEQLTQLPAGGNYIIMGNIDNPLIKNYCLDSKIEVNSQNPGKEGYILTINDNNIIVAGRDDAGAFYGLQSLRQLLKIKDKNIFAPGVNVRDWPKMPFRGIKVYVPGKESIPFFERFLKDFMALYKYNKLILEVNAVMRLDRHPELNAGSVEFGKELIYSRRERPVGPNRENQNSTHHDAGDGGILEKREVADIVEFANDQYIEVIPEITSLTHSYYLLTRHRELAEIKDAEWPDTYCPSNPKSYELLFDVMDEYIEVMNPGMIMIGHDEWRMPLDVCPLCKGKDNTELFAEDVNKVYDYLSRKEIRVAMWGDHFMESVRDKGIRKGSDYHRSYDRPGALSPEQVKASIPKDIVIFNWFWSGENGEDNDIQVEEMGFKQIYGNFRPTIENWKRRSERNSVMGGAPSSWAASTEFNFGKDLMNDFLGCANLLWSQHWPDERELLNITQSMIPVV